MKLLIKKKLAELQNLQHFFISLSAFSSIFIFMIGSLGIIKGNAPIITLENGM